MSKLSSVERIREYLEESFGLEVLKSIYPIVKSFGDDILLADKIPELKEKLKPYLSKSTVDKYHTYFATLIFYELEIEKNESMKVKEQFNPSGMMNAINCFKDVSATATFGKFGMTTIGKTKK